MATTTDTTIDTDIAALRERLANATPEALAFMGIDGVYSGEVRTCEKFTQVCTIADDGQDPTVDAMVFAFNLAPRLLAEIDRLRKAVTL